LLANILLLIGFQKEMQLKEWEVANMQYDFQSNLSDCGMMRDTYHQRLLEVAGNCLVYVFKKQNETVEETRFWAYNFLNNLTEENKQYRLRLAECSRRVGKLEKQQCN
jgi:hypothetical protein